MVDEEAAGALAGGDVADGAGRADLGVAGAGEEAVDEAEKARASHVLPSAHVLAILAHVLTILAHRVLLTRASAHVLPSARVLPSEHVLTILAHRSLLTREYPGQSALLL